MPVIPDGFRKYCDGHTCSECGKKLYASEILSTIVVLAFFLSMIGILLGVTVIQRKLGLDVVNCYLVK